MKNGIKMYSLKRESITQRVKKRMN